MGHRQGEAAPRADKGRGSAVGEVPRGHAGGGGGRPDPAARGGALRSPVLLGTTSRCHPRAGPGEHSALRLGGDPARPRRGNGLKAPPGVLDREQSAFLVRRRVARLATADGAGKPHAVPVCFALTQASIYVALDEKPKTVPASGLKRVRNILENPHVALIADRYDEDWELLAFVMVRGRAELLEPGEEEHTAAVRLLKGKYHQYETMRIEENPVIAI